MSTSKSNHKSSRSRPVATSTLANPVAEQQNPVVLCAFSSDAAYFAHVIQVINRHRLRVCDAVTGAIVAEHSLDNARITALAWGKIPTSDEEVEGAPTKRRKKRRNQSSSAANNSNVTEAVVFGTSDGAVVCYSHLQARVLYTLNESAPNSPITVNEVPHSDPGHLPPSLVWSCSEDGFTRIWDIRTSKVVSKWQLGDSQSFSSLSHRPHASDRSFILGGSTLVLFSNDRTSALVDSDAQPTEIMRLSGHVSSVTKIEWEHSSQPRRFVSMSPKERFFSIWEVPSPGSSTSIGLLASVALDDDLRHVCVDQNGSSERQMISAVSASGKCLLYQMPNAKVESKSSLNPQCAIRISYGKQAQSVHLLSASFVPQLPGTLRLVSFVGGVKAAFHDVAALDESGNYKSEIPVDLSASIPTLVSVDEPVKPVSLKRYVEKASVNVGGVSDVPMDPEALVVRQQHGALDVEMAELSLGQRLSAMQGVVEDGESGENATTNNVKSKSRRGKQREDDLQSVPVSSLSRTLIQALHSSDSRLLESCLAHSDPKIIRNTVQRLPPQLAVPLISACVERLGRGHRGANMKGGGGGASAQRGTVMVAWIKEVLINHSGHLMAMPDLVTRLAGLHTVLTNRLKLQDRLLNLSGRLDLILAQMELRSSSSAKSDKQDASEDKQNESKVTRYVEGESSDEDGDVAIEEGEDEGSVEDIDIGTGGGDTAGREIDDMPFEGINDTDDDSEGGDEEDEAEFSGSEEDDDSDADSDSDDSEPHLNGFVDEDAEVYTADEDENDSE